MAIKTNKNELTLAPISKNRLHEEIVRQVQKKILTGQLKIGEKLPPERELAAMFQVNRGTVREALKKLELLGLIEICHGEGIYVRDYLGSGNLELLRAIISMDDEINPEIIKHLLEIRRILVPRMAGLAAELCGQEHITELEKLIANSDISMQDKDLTVHQVIARAGRNIFYIFILNFFNQLFLTHGHVYFNNEKNIEKSKQFHKDILDAFMNRDREKAKRITSDVLEYSENEILAFLNIK